jgi:hypothetical protein
VKETQDPLLGDWKDVRYKPTKESKSYAVLDETQYRRAKACVDALRGLDPGAVGDVIKLAIALKERHGKPDMDNVDFIPYWMVGAHEKLFDALAKLEAK